MRRQRRRKQPENMIKGFPTAPGWYVQWCGRTDWQSMDETGAKLLAKIIVAQGDRVLHIGQMPEAAR